MEGEERVGTASSAIEGGLDPTASRSLAEFFARLMLERKWEFVVGVAGSTFIDACGDLPTLLLPGLWRVSRLFEDAEEALLCVWWRGILRIDETDEDVDLRPRSPTEPRR